MSRSREQATSRLDDARARMYRDLIFESAECVFGEKGFAGATMQDIASEAGVSLKTVYARFPGKRELYEEIMAVRGQAMSDAIASARALGQTPVAKLELGTRAFVRFLFEHADWLRIHLRSRLTWSVRPQEGVGSDLWDQGRDGYAEIFREGIAAGLFWEDDPLELAVLVQALTKVQVSQAIEGGETDPEAVADRLMERLFRLVQKGAVGIREAG